MNDATIRLVAQQGSLNLIENTGVPKDSPDRFTVQLRDTPHKCEGLKKARRSHRIHGLIVNGSQAVTIKTWAELYL